LANTYFGSRVLLTQTRGINENQARPQNVDAADVMQECSHLTLFVPGNSVSYASLRS
jgi:hypothetical protein